eukprot:3690572-Prorocentrum_lima.AAC.1
MCHTYTARSEGCDIHPRKNSDAKVSTIVEFSTLLSLTCLRRNSETSPAHRRLAQTHPALHPPLS